MEVDSMHSSIESAKKHTSVYSMTEWVNIFRRARSSKKTKNKIQKPYNVRELKFSEFKDLKELAASVMGKKISTNAEGNRVYWLKIKRMKYVKGEMKLYYNYDMSENFFFIDLTPTNSNQVSFDLDPPVHHYSTRKRKKRADDAVIQNVRIIEPELPAELTQLYRKCLPISKAKKADLLKLCSKGVIPEEYHDWYEKIETEDSIIDRLPDATVSDKDTSDEE